MLPAHAELPSLLPPCYSFTGFHLTNFQGERFVAEGIIGHYAMDKKFGSRWKLFVRYHECDKGYGVVAVFDAVATYTYGISE